MTALVLLVLAASAFVISVNANEGKVGIMFEIYGTINCIFCDKAKILLGMYELEYKFINVAESAEINTAFFRKFPDVKTVPQITSSDGHWIGGYTELKKWQNHIE